MIDEEVPAWAYDKAESFFTDVREKVIDVQETIRNTDRVTPGQKRALDNWAEGVGKFVPE